MNSDLVFCRAAAEDGRGDILNYMYPDDFDLSFEEFWQIRRRRRAAAARRITTCPPGFLTLAAPLYKKWIRNREWIQVSTNINQYNLDGQKKGGMKV